MTAQFSDSVKYRGQDYAIAGRNGGELFDPTQHGMEPVGKCSACWRGFLCSYAVDGQQLLLDELEVCLDGPAPVLFGVQPRPEEHLFDVVYKDLRHRVPYSGGLLLARDFIRELYVHMGFHPAWKFREVHELVFHEGALVEESDCSAKVAELREQITERPLKPGYNATESEIKRWIAKCFSQDYRW